MVKRLIAVGCSYTADDYDFPVWPELLSKKLGLSCVNLGQCGSGNEAIYSKSLDALVSRKNIGMMVVMWSEFQRTDYFLESCNMWNTIHFVVDGNQRNSEKWKAKVAALLDNNGYNSKKHQINRTLRFMYSIQKLCEMRNIPFIQVFGTDPCPQHEKYNAGNTILNSPFFDLMNCIGWPITENIGGSTIDSILNRTTHRIDDNDGHPGKLGHERIVEILLDNLEIL